MHIFYNINFLVSGLFYNTYMYIPKSEHRIFRPPPPPLKGLFLGGGANRMWVGGKPPKLQNATLIPIESILNCTDRALIIMSYLEKSIKSFLVSSYHF